MVLVGLDGDTILHTILIVVEKCPSGESMSETVTPYPCRRNV